jgi:hypothetical protein
MVVSSNYKGFPICQANSSHDELQSNSSMEFGLQITGALADSVDQ